MEKRPNDGLFEFLDKAGTFVMANLLWVAVALPIITLPASLAGLFNVMSRWVRGESVEVFRDFFAGIRENWRQATVVGIVDILVGGLIAFNIFAFGLMNMSEPIAILSRSVTLFVGLFVIMVNLYLWPLMVTVDWPVRRLLDTSVKLVFVHPVWSIVMLGLALIPVMMTLFLPAGALVLVSLSSFALLVSWGAWRILRRYFPKEEYSGENAGK